MTPVSLVPFPLSLAVTVVAMSEVLASDMVRDSLSTKSRVSWVTLFTTQGSVWHERLLVVFFSLPSWEPDMTDPLDPTLALLSWERRRDTCEGALLVEDEDESLELASSSKACFNLEMSKEKAKKMEQMKYHDRLKVFALLW